MGNKQPPEINNPHELSFQKFNHFQIRVSSEPNKSFKVKVDYLDPNVLINYDIIFNKLKLTKQALNLYQKAVKINPDNVRAN